jgi:hypothetical protein
MLEKLRQAESPEYIDSVSRSRLEVPARTHGDRGGSRPGQELGANLHSWVRFHPDVIDAAAMQWTCRLC